jgi:serine/threonine-protein phosphatase PP1 catalytic subunit
MPLCALIDEQVFCVHGGLPRALVSSQNILAEIASIVRPINVASQLVSDLLWNDPVRNSLFLLMLWFCSSPV